MAATASTGWWSDAQLQAMQRALAAPLAAWARDWVPGGEPLWPAVRCQLAWQALPGAASEWHGVGSTHAGTVWMECGSSHALASWLFGAPSLEEGGGEIAGAVASRALEALLGEIRKSLGLAGPRNELPPDSIFRPWSGGVTATVQGPGATPLRLLIEGACVAGVVPQRLTPRRQRAPLARVDAACAEQPVRASVRLAAFEVDIGTLASLRIGDVLAAPHVLALPMQVTVGEQEVCTGYLGRIGASRAIELARSDEASTPV